MKFCITTSQYIPSNDIIATVESSIRNVDKPTVDNIRAKISLALQQTKLLQMNISRRERNALMTLKKDGSLTILPVGKGRATVILDHEKYLEKCYEHINNGPYKRLKKDPTESIKRTCLNKLKDLKSRELIDQKLYYKLRPTGSPAPKFYSLSKIHKKGRPLRPTLSYTGTPLYKLSKYVATILSNYIQRDGRHSMNSKVFSEYVRTLHIDDDEVMVSFDVTSLYTNVPI